MAYVPVAAILDINTDINTDIISQILFLPTRQLLEKKTRLTHKHMEALRQACLNVGLSGAQPTLFEHDKALAVQRKVIEAYERPNMNLSAALWQ